MLSLADVEIVRRDPAVPGLATLLDEERLLATLRTACPRSSIEGLSVNYARYKPGVGCVVGFSLAVRGSQVAAYARTNSSDRAIAAIKAGRAPNVPNLVGSRFALCDGATVVSVFPNDRRMASLLRIAEPDRLDSLLKDLLPTSEHLRAGARIEPLAYRPEHSFVARLVSRDGHQAVLKFPGDRSYKSMSFRTERFGGGTVRVAALLGCSDHHRAQVFEWLDGRVLKDALQDSAFDIHTMRLVGAALADFHAHVRPGLIEITPAMMREALQAHTAAISTLCPHLAELAHGLSRLLGDPPADEPRVHRRLHGDFHPRQILISGQTVAFLDLGDGLVGHPTIDLGLFLAHLEREAIRRKLGGNWVEHLAAAFLNGYEAAGGIPLRKWMRRALARGLFCLAPHSFRHRELDWTAQMTQLLERAQEVANGRNEIVA